MLDRVQEHIWRCGCGSLHDSLKSMVWWIPPSIRQFCQSIWLPLPQGWDMAVGEPSNKTITQSIPQNPHRNGYVTTKSMFCNHNRMCRISIQSKICGLNWRGQFISTNTRTWREKLSDAISVFFSSTHCRANNIAHSSVVYTDKWSDNLFLMYVSLMGIYTAAPAHPVSGSFVIQIWITQI